MRWSDVVELAMQWPEVSEAASYGKSGGGLCYGYKVVKKLDSQGEPIRSDREIDEGEANVVRPILRDYVEGVTSEAKSRNAGKDSPLRRGRPRTVRSWAAERDKLSYRQLR